jgi:hypothetical protein
MNADPKVRTLEDSFIYDLGKNYEGYEILSIYGNKGGSLSATYNETKEELIRVIEKYKDVKLPFCYLFCIQSYPGWQIVNDRYLYSQRGRYLKKQYNLKIKRKRQA